MADKTGADKPKADAAGSPPHSDDMDKLTKTELDAAFRSFKKRFEQVKDTDYKLPKKTNIFKDGPDPKKRKRDE